MKHKNADAVKNVTTRKRGVVTNVKRPVKGAVKNGMENTKRTTGEYA